MATVSEQEKILAHAIFEIRVLLSSYLGSSTHGDLAVREAANLAYALHNQALSSLAGQSFDTDSAYSSIASVDKLLNTNLVTRFAKSGLAAPA